ncbi:MAG: hypoxanthine-guanine phosphoribosyltransferase [Gammaproteobacteria bacterium]
MDPITAPERATMLYSAEEVDAALQRMAMEISDDLAETRPFVIAVMNGGVFTAVNLCRHFRFVYEFDFVHVTRYGSAFSGGDIEWRVRPPAALEGRTVLLVDDIRDKGVTLTALHGELRRIGVTDFRTAVLVNKRIADERVRPRIDYFALETDDVYLFGCGMDYAGYWRGLPEIYACEPE